MQRNDGNARTALKYCTNTLTDFTFGIELGYIIGRLSLAGEYYGEISCGIVKPLTAWIEQSGDYSFKIGELGEYASEDTLVYAVIEVGGLDD
jgi:hypothetical protein